MKKKILLLIALIFSFCLVLNLDNVKALDELSNLPAGLYDDNNNLIASWDTLVNDYGLDVSSDAGAGYYASYNYYYQSYDWYYYNDDPYENYQVDFDDLPDDAPFKILMSTEFSSATKIKIPEGVTKIGNNALYNVGYKVISLPSTLNYISVNGLATDDYDIMPEKIYLNCSDDTMWYSYIPGYDYNYSYTMADLSPEDAAYEISFDNNNYIWINSNYNVFNFLTDDNVKAHIIEFLTNNYNVVTLGTHTKNTISSFPYRYNEFRNGSVLNSYSIGGPVLIKGDLTTKSGDGIYCDNYNNCENKEFAPEIIRADTPDTPSYIGGRIEGSSVGNTTTKSLSMGGFSYMDRIYAYLYIDDTINTLDRYYNSGSYSINNMSDIDSYNRIRSNRNINVDFDTLYDDIINEQVKINQGTELSFTNTDYTTAEESIIVTTPGYYTIDLSNIDSFPWKSKIVNIVNYNPTATYVITIKGKYIYTPIEIQINGRNATNINHKDSTYLGKYNDDVYYGNVLVSYPEAEYIYLNKENIGHVIAPNADVEVNSWRIVGSIIANSITIENDYRISPSEAVDNDTLGNTAIQFYPYGGNELDILDSANDYETDIRTTIYQGSYDLIDLLKNYSIITLGKNMVNSNAELSLFNNAEGTADVYYVAAPILINGNYGNDRDGDDPYDLFSYVSDYNNGKLFESSYIAGRMKGSSSDKEINADLKYKMDSKEVYFGTGNSFLQTLGYHTPYWNSNDFNVNVVSGYILFPENRYNSMNYVSNLIAGNRRYKLYKPVFKTDSYINFDDLYDSITSTQATFASGKTVSPDSNGILHLSYGKAYTIENINDVNTIIFDNPEGKDKLTLINILDNGTIDAFPNILLEDDNGNTSDILTNKYYNYHTKIYDSDTIIENEVYEGNIIWSIPNARYINMSETSFVGHIIAPNADIDMPEMDVAGTIIANSVYADGKSEVHYYPYRLNSFAVDLSVDIHNLDDLTRDYISDFRYELYEGETLIDSWTTDDDSYELSSLRTLRTYKLKQVSNTDPYFDIDPITFTINANGEIESDDENISVENSDLLVLNIRKRTIKATIEWDDEDNKYGIRPTTVKVRLLANNVEIRSFDVTEDNLTIEAIDLPLSKNGTEIEYRILEDVIANYTSSDEHTVISQISDPIRVDEYTIVNSYGDTDVLGERDDNPYTGDRIDKSFVILAISIIGLIAAIIIIFILKKKKKK